MLGTYIIDVRFEVNVDYKPIFNAEMPSKDMFHNCLLSSERLKTTLCFETEK